MFSGLVQEVGRVLAKQVTQQFSKLKVSLSNPDNFQIGDSIAVNGVCLTVTTLGKDWFEADLMPQTMVDTNLQYLQVGESVNLESALKYGDPIGGHLVSGHVDGVGKILSLREQANAVIVEVAFSPELGGYLVHKGSIAVDGVSLTIQELKNESLVVSLIPHTFKQTRFKELKTGSLVNLEVDMMAKHLCTQQKSNITVDFLRENGFC